MNKIEINDLRLLLGEDRKSLEAYLAYLIKMRKEIERIVSQNKTLREQSNISTHSEEVNKNKSMHLK